MGVQSRTAASTLPGAAVPTVRNGTQIRLSLMAIQELLQSEHVRLVALGKGGYLAAGWVSGELAASPVSGIDCSGPTRAEVESEILTAGDVAADPAAACDEVRIMARGAEEWLAWACISGYPGPPWLTPGRDTGEVADLVLGQVGLSPAGLRGSGSTARFPYAVRDFLRI